VPLKAHGLKAWSPVYIVFWGKGSEPLVGEAWDEKVRSLEYALEGGTEILVPSLLSLLSGCHEVNSLLHYVLSAMMS
jgi:hypothetical protein